MTRWNPFALSRGLLAIDQRPHALSALQLANRNGCWTVIASALMDVVDDQLNPAIWTHLRQQLGLSKRRKVKVTSTLCTSKVITKIIKPEVLPYDDQQAGAQIIGDAESIFPCALAELGYDYSLTHDNQLRVDAAKLSALRARVEPLQTAQFDPLILEPSDEALLRAMRFFGPHCAPNLVRADHALALLEISDEGLHWLVIHQHDVIFSRQHLGAIDPTTMTTTVQHWIELYLQQPLPELTSLALTGEHALQDDNSTMTRLQMQLHQTTQLPVWLFDPFTQAPNVCQINHSQFQHHRRGAYVRALGLALRNINTWWG